MYKYCLFTTILKTKNLPVRFQNGMNIQFAIFRVKKAILLPNTMVFISHHPLNAVSNIMEDTLELS